MSGTIPYAGHPSPRGKYTADDVNKFVAAHPDSFVVLYAKWCHFSKDLLHELGLQDPEISLPKNKQFPNVLLIEEKEMSDEIAPEGYPTVQRFVGGQLLDDPNNENHRNLVDYVMHHTGAAEGKEWEEQGEEQGEEVQKLINAILERDEFIKKLIKRNKFLEKKIRSL